MERVATNPGRWTWLTLGVWLGFSSVVVQLTLMREMLALAQGNELILGVLLAEWLWWTGIGSWLEGRRETLPEPRPWLTLLLVLAVVPPLLMVLLRVVVPRLIGRGVSLDLVQCLAVGAVVLAPYGLCSGALWARACGALSAGGFYPGSAVSRVYAADSVGSVVGGALFTWVLVRRFDHGVVLGVPALLGLAVMGAAAWSRRAWAGMGIAAGCVALMVPLVLSGWLDRWSTAEQYAPVAVKSGVNSPYQRLVITESAGQVDGYGNGLPLFSLPPSERAEELVHCTLSQRPGAQRVLLVGGGMAGAIPELLKYPLRQLTYVELDPAITELGRRLMPAWFADPRLEVIVTDGRRFVQTTDCTYDVMILDTASPVNSQVNRFYTREFFAAARRVLVPGGVLGFGLGGYDNYVSPELQRVLACAHRTLRLSFPEIQLLPASRVLFLASTEPLHLDIADRIEAAGVSVRWVRRSYVEGQFTPDRRADLTRAVAESGPVNEDLRPILVLHHLRHWLSQHETGWWIAMVPVGLGGIWALRLKPVPRAVCAAGFAASSLEFAVLLAFQAVYGSLYREIGLLVAIFMGGLAVGGMAGARSGVTRSARGLAWLGFALAAFAASLPWILAGVGHGTAADASAVVGQGMAMVAILGLGLLVGLQFGLASRISAEPAARVGGRLFLADLVGAGVGALLGGAVLVPVLGLTSVCWVAAGLNGWAGLGLWRVRERPVVR